MRIAAIRAQLGVADVVALGADPQVVFDVEQRCRQPRGIVARGAQDMEREPLRRFLADAGQAFELVDQARSGAAKSGINRR